MASPFDTQVDPVELTWAARDLIAEQEAQNYLSQFLPTVTSDDGRFSIDSLTSLGVQVAEYRAFDTRPTMIDRDFNESKRSGRIPPMSTERVMREYESIIEKLNRGELFVQQAYQDVARTVLPLWNRIKLAQGEVISTGKVTLQENGIDVEIDFGHTPAREETAAVAWTDTVNATVWSDIQNAEAAASDLRGGISSDVMIMAASTLTLIRRNAEVRDVAYAIGDRPMVRRSELESEMAAEGMPTIHVFDEKVGAQRVLPENDVIFAANGFGNTVYGVTAEVASGQVPLTGNDRPGVISLVEIENRPYKVVTYSNTTALPAVDPNGFYKLTTR